MTRGKTRIRRSLAEWGVLVELRERSGLNRQAFCRREGISRATLDKWEHRLATPPVKGRFVEMAREPGVPESWDLEVRLPGGAVLRFRG